MKKLAAPFVGALTLAGCGSVRYPTSYLLNLPAPTPQLRRRKRYSARSRSVSFAVRNTSARAA